MNTGRDLRGPTAALTWPCGLVPLYCAWSNYADVGRLRGLSGHSAAVSRALGAGRGSSLYSVALVAVAGSLTSSLGVRWGSAGVACTDASPVCGRGRSTQALLWGVLRGACTGLCRRAPCAWPPPGQRNQSLGLRPHIQGWQSSPPRQLSRAAWGEPLGWLKGW